MMKKRWKRALFFKDIPIFVVKRRRQTAGGLFRRFSAGGVWQCRSRRAAPENPSGEGL